MDNLDKNANAEYLENVRIIQARAQAQKANEIKYKENSKKKLLAIIEKKFKTTMIGSLAKFEENFGFLWGHGKDKLNDSELQFRKLWEETRTEVLNNGNNQLRGAQDEMANYSLSFDRYETKFIIGGKKNDN